MCFRSACRKAFLPLFIFLIAADSSAHETCTCKEAEQLRAPMGMHFNSGQLDSAEFYTKKLLSFKETGCAIYFQDWMAQIALARKDYTSARTYLETEKRLLKENECHQDLYVRYYSTVAKLFQELNIFDSLVTSCLNGIEAAQDVNDQYGLSRASADLAAAFAQLGQHEKAIQYYRQSLEAAKKQTKAPALMASVLTRLSTQYLTEFERSGDTNYADSAAIFAKQALDTASKYRDLLAYLEANETLATHALLTKNYGSAIQFAEVLISTSPRAHLFDRLTYAGFSKKSEALLELKDFIPAEQFADSALLYAQAFNPQMMVGAFEKIYRAARANNNLAKSLAAHEKMSVLRDSLFTIQKNSVVSELEKKYNQARNEKTITELAQQRKIYLLLALAGLLGLIAFVFLIRQQGLKNKHRVMEAEQRLNRARINPHFFFNALSSLQSFALQENDGKALAADLSKFSHIMRETLESTYKEYITIEQETDFLNKYLELQKMRFPGKFTYEIVSSKHIEPYDMLIPAMILQPFVENSIEHGFSGINYAGHIAIFFEKEGNNMQIRIVDNGKGLGNTAGGNNDHISRAMQIIKDRIYLLNIKLKTKASFAIENNTNEKGVTVLISLPLLYNQAIKG